MQPQIRSALRKCLRVVTLAVGRHLGRRMRRPWYTQQPIADLELVVPHHGQLNIITTRRRRLARSKPASGLPRSQASGFRAGKFIEHPPRSKAVSGVEGDDMGRIEQRNFDGCRNQHGAHRAPHGTIVDENQSGIVDLEPIIDPMMIYQARPLAAMSVRALIGNKHAGYCWSREWSRNGCKKAIADPAEPNCDVATLLP
jgi:hypothetical protein